MDKGRILVVDDDALSRVLCADMLAGANYYVKDASDGPAALELLEAERFDIVVTDLVMPGMDGIELMANIKQRGALIDIIVATGHASMESAISALKKGAFDYITKPVNEDELLLIVANCMEKKRLLEENHGMRQSLKLFEVSRTLTSTIDIDRLYNIALDALLQLVPSEAGMVAFYAGETKDLRVKATRHLDDAIAEEMIGLFKNSLEKTLRGHDNIFVVSAEELGDRDGSVLKGFNSIMVVPLIVGSASVGFLFTLSKVDKNDYAVGDVRNADFIAAHASQAFDHAQKYVEAKEMAFVDPLTNLYNSKYLETALDKELKRADRLMMPVTVLFIDIDNFKTVNDTNDHLVGSKMLVQVGEILLKCVREVDTVVRYGGDEYVIILIDADSETGFRVAERIRASIEENDFMKDEGLDLKITASIGVATYPLHTRERRELLKMADRAMYTAKDMSKNLVYLAPVSGGDIKKARDG
jgi:diguanylate cyclase (GGDEF)-like protein